MIPAKSHKDGHTFLATSIVSAAEMPNLCIVLVEIGISVIQECKDISLHRLDSGRFLILAHCLPWVPALEAMWKQCSTNRSFDISPGTLGHLSCVLLSAPFAIHTFWQDYTRKK